MMEGSFQGIAEALGADITSQEDGTRIGVTPVMWDSGRPLVLMLV